MKFFGRGGDKEKETRQFHRDIAIAHMQTKANTMNLSNQQQLNSLGTAYFLQQDENVLKVIMEECPELIPAFSRMNATSKIEKPRDKRMMQLYFKDILLHLEMELGDEGDIGDRSFIKSLGINAEFRILDAMGGYRGRLVTEEIERTTHVLEQPKKKGIL